MFMVENNTFLWNIFSPFCKTAGGAEIFLMEIMESILGYKIPVTRQFASPVTCMTLPLHSV